LILFGVLKADAPLLAAAQQRRKMADLPAMLITRIS
jgi:hypothetical protein